MSKLRDVELDTASIRSIARSGGVVLRDHRILRNVSYRLSIKSVLSLREGIWKARFDGYTVYLPATDPESVPSTQPVRAVKAPSKPFNPVFS